MKLNKQGVRDLNSLPRKTAPAPGSFIAGPGSEEAFGKNQMPGEMASKLLTEEPKTSDFGPPLTPLQREFLEILAEECAETVQRVTKILRFGVRKNPWNGKDNLRELEKELADIHAASTALVALEFVNAWNVHVALQRKLTAFVTEENPERPRLRHMTPEFRELLASVARGLEDL